MKRSETSPNRKAFPKFLKWLLISAAVSYTHLTLPTNSLV